MNSHKSEIIKNFPFLGMDDVDLLISISELRSVDSNVILVCEGEFNSNVHLVLEGLLRSYVSTSAGEERTVLLTKERMRAASLNSILNNGPAEISIESLEPSVILSINSLKFQKLIPIQPKLAKMEKDGMTEFLSDAMERLHFFTVLSPEERFISFREKHPDLIQRVPQKYLASFLGVTTVSLSRIKSRIAKN